MLEAVLVVGMLVCALAVLRAERLLTAALWLAGVSVLVALMLYQIGAKEIAVIELSVGAGLVTVLFVFAISVAGDEAMKARSIVPKPVAWGLIILALALLGYLILPLPEAADAPAETSFLETLWQQRALDVLVQIVMIFSGVLGFVGLLSEPKAKQAAQITTTAATELTLPAAEELHEKELA